MAIHRQTEMSTTWWPTAVAAVVAVFAFPVCYIFTEVCQSFHPLLTLLVALLILGVVLLVIISLTQTVENKLYYGFAFYVFTGIADLICGLETSGHITGFMSLYLKHAEPYLLSAWGSMAMYWDGTGFTVCYLIMAHCAANGKSYRSVGLHWSAAILNSMIVLLVGACLSESGLRWCTLLNIIYVVFPVIVGAQCLAEPQQIRQEEQQDRKLSWIDTLLAVLLLQATLAAIIRGLATLDSQQYFPHWHRSKVEPILMQNHPAPFAALQGLISLFYYAPSFALLAWGLLKYPTKGWLLDLALITAGATSEAGVVMVGMSLHNLTEPQHKMPSYYNHAAFFTFWTVNILIAIVPQLLIFRLLWLPTTQGRDRKNE